MSMEDAPSTSIVGEPSNVEWRFQRFLHAVLVSQEAQTIGHKRQADLAQFQTHVLEVIERVV